MGKWIWTILGLGAVAGVAFILWFLFDPGAIEKYRTEIQAEAKEQLTYVCKLETDHKELHGTYSMNMDAIGFYQEATEKTRWWLEILSADSIDFVARAYAQMDLDEDGVQNIWEIRKDCKPREIQED